jgi:uncharacterized protein (DUF4415 family)
VPTGKASRVKSNSAQRNSAKRTGATNWAKLRSLSATAIREGIQADPDALATDAAFWKDANVVLPTRKSVVTMRLDADLLEWFRQQRGYQTRINAILRAYMKAQASERRG